MQAGPASGKLLGDDLPPASATAGPPAEPTGGDDAAGIDEDGDYL